MCAYQSGILIWYWYVRIWQIHMMENIKMIWQHKWPKLLRKNTRLMTSFNILFSLSSFLSVRTCYMHCGWTIWVEGFNREYYLTRIMGFCITIMYQLTFRSIYVTISPKNSMHIVPLPPYSSDLAPRDFWQSQNSRNHSGERVSSRLRRKKRRKNALVVCLVCFHILCGLQTDLRVMGVCRVGAANFF